MSGRGRHGGRGAHKGGFGGGRGRGFGRKGGSGRGKAKPDASLSSVMEHEPIRNALFQMMDVGSAMNLAETSTSMRSAVAASAPNVAAVQGVRRITMPSAAESSAASSGETQSATMWTKTPASEPKRYFQEMPARGVPASVPHLSEQTGFPRHLTDVAAVPPISGRPTVATVQFPEVGGSAAGYKLGSADVPDGSTSKSRKSSRFYHAVPSPNTNALPEGTHVNPRYYNAAATGALTQGAPRPQLSPQQSSQTVAGLEGRWAGATVTGRDRPTIASTSAAPTHSHAATATSGAGAGAGAGAGGRGRGGRGGRGGGSAHKGGFGGRRR